MINKKVKNAIEAAVAQEGQPPELAAKLVAWMEHLMDGDEDIADKDKYLRRANVCFEATVTTPANNE
jgi:hypothetical protein